MDETKQKFLDKMHPPRAEEQIVSYRKWMLYLFLCASQTVSLTSTSLQLHKLTKSLKQWAIKWR